MTTRAEDDVAGFTTMFNSGGFGCVVAGFAFGCPLERFQRERLSQLVLHEKSAEGEEDGDK
jgi:hypothetical protein